MQVKRVIFVCVHNSGRSQMAEAFAKRLAEGIIEAQSAGTKPSEGLNPAAVQAMNEIGCDMSGHHPKMLTMDMANSADMLITMGCGVQDEEGATCPVADEDWALDDPHGQPIEKVREIRDQVEARVEDLIARLKES
jgi:arsenate reductase